MTLWQAFKEIFIPRPLTKEERERRESLARETVRQHDDSWRDFLDEASPSVKLKLRLCLLSFFSAIVFVPIGGLIYALDHQRLFGTMPCPACIIQTSFAVMTLGMYVSIHMYCSYYFRWRREEGEKQ